MGFFGMILRRSELPVQLVRADIRSVLISHAVGIKRFVRDCNRVFARLSGRLTHSERIFANMILRLETDELNDDMGFFHSALAVGSSSMKLLLNWLTLS